MLNLLLCNTKYLLIPISLPSNNDLRSTKTKMMKVENTKAQMRKGILEYCILSILAKDDAYVAEILASLKEAKLLVVEGTIYPLLTRLKNTGLLTYRWEESTGGPPRKYYQLTEKGQGFLSELGTTWKELQTAVNIITQPNK